MKKIKLFLASLVAVLSAGSFMSPALATVSAQSATENIQCGVAGNLSGEGDCGSLDEGVNTINNTIRTVIRTFQIIVGLISVIMIIFGGLKYITSGGESNSVKGAKNTILYAVIGLVVVAIAEAIVQFVLKRFEA